MCRRSSSARSIFSIASSQRPADTAALVYKLTAAIVWNPALVKKAVARELEPIIHQIAPVLVAENRMRFIKDGPNVPERLVQTHEDGNVVFFCGAGISYPAGLPGFSGLITSVYRELGENLDPVEQAAFKASRFDTVFYLLERRVGKRSVVREKLWKILTAVDLTNRKSTETQQSILTLSKTRDGQTRLVTTNFDRLFQAVEPTISSYSAPLLPIPKRTR